MTLTKPPQYKASVMMCTHRKSVKVGRRIGPAMRQAFRVLSVVILAASLLTPASVLAADDRRNVILIIGDGMDDQQITMARNYLEGAKGSLLLDQLPLRSISQVLTVDDESPSTPVYVADSANSATAMATGVVTSRGRIATTAGDDQDIPTIAELAKEAGFSTGIVTSASVTDATPAAFISHVALRTCENPKSMRPSDDHPFYLDPSRCYNDRITDGGKGSIAQQIASGHHDLILGGGQMHFKQKAENSERSILQLAETNGYQLLNSSEQLAKLQASKKVLGLFADETLPTRLRGEDGRKAEKPKPSLLRMIDWRLGSVEFPEPMTCEKNPDYGNTPGLKAMTEAAISHLSAQDNKGFFLMVESASIDKQSHKANPCGSIGELEQLDEALASALAFAEKEPNTLILVTADHGQAAQIIPDNSMYSGIGLAVYTPGRVARIITRENQIMSVNYATNDFLSQEHSGVSVPLLSNEEGRGLVAPMVTQPDIFRIARQYLFGEI